MKKCLLIIFIILFLLLFFLKRNDFFKSKTTYSNLQVNCEIYSEQINNSLMQFNVSQKHEIRDSDNTGENASFGLYIEYKSIKDLFYSPITKSCLYVESSKTLFKPSLSAQVNKGEWLVAYDTHYLIDAVTTEKMILKDNLPQAQRIVRGSEFYSEKEIQDSINLYK